VLCVRSSTGAGTLARSISSPVALDSHDKGFPRSTSPGPPRGHNKSKRHIHTQMDVPQPPASQAACESSPKIPTKVVLHKPPGSKSPKVDKGPTLRPISWGSGVWICEKYPEKICHVSKYSFKQSC